MTQAQRRNTSLLIGATAAISDFGIALFIFGLPYIDLYFAEDPWYGPYIVASALALIGLSLSFTGALADFYGRRPVIIAFLVTSAGLTFICILAINYKFLLVMRAVQIIIGAAGLVIARTIASDINTTKAGVSKTMGLPVLAVGTSYLFAASLSGWLNNNFGWHSVTMMVGILMAAVTLWIVWNYEESARLSRRYKYFFAAAFWHHIRLWGSVEFLGHALILSFSMISFVSFLLLFPSLALQQYGLSTWQLGVINIFVFAALGLGTVVNHRYVERLGIPAFVRHASLAVMALGAAFGGLGLIASLSIEILVPVFLLLAFIIGAAHPALLAACVSVDPERAGTAAGLAAGLALLCSAGAYQLCISALGGGPGSLATVAAVGALLTGLSYGLLLRPKKIRRRRGEVDFSRGGVQGSNGL